MKLKTAKIFTVILLLAIQAGCAPLWFAGGAATGAAVDDDDDDSLG